MRYKRDNNKALIKEISILSGINPETVKTVINTLAGYFYDALKDGETVQLVPLGKFETSVKRGRELPMKDKSGEPLYMKKQRKITFKPSKELKEAMILE